MWDFSLVDPDNRRPVDYERRRRLLNELDDAVKTRGQASVAEELTAEPARRSHEADASNVLLRFPAIPSGSLPDAGDYRALDASGTRHDHLFAFARPIETSRWPSSSARLTGSLLPDADTSAW